MREKNETKTWLLCMALVMTTGLFTACSDEDKIPVDDDTPGIVENQPVTDTVKTTLSKKVCVLWDTENANIKAFLQKRISNLSNSLSEDAEIIIMGESEAAQVLKDESARSLLKELWNQNKPVVFIRPAQNALAVYAMLCGDEGKAFSQETLDRYGKYSIFAVKSDGVSMTYDRFPSTYTYQIEGYETDDKDQQTFVNETITAEFVPNDYHWGQMAENVCQWLENNVGTESRVHPAFRSRVAAEDINYYVNTQYKTLTVKYDGYYNDPAPRAVTTEVIFSYITGYNKLNEFDVYDIKIEEKFPAQESYIENMYTEEKAAYNYKYTGGFYEGPMVKLYLTEEDEKFDFQSYDNTTLLSPTPIMEASEVSTTHYPGNWTFGGSVGGSLGYKEAGGSASFSFSYTLPTTTLTTVASEMPVEYTSTDNLPVWKYSLTCDYDNVYINKWGSNGHFHSEKIPDIAKGEVRTSQMVSFAVKNTKESLGEKKVTLHADVNFKCHEVASSPFNEMHHTINNNATYTLDMPVVFRYFEKYTPSPYKMGANADAANWNNLESLLMSNVNYKAFKDETLTVGAVTEAKLDSTAQSIWEETVNSLIKQYNGRMNPACEYIIGLADSDGDYLPIGLQIKTDSSWTKVNL